MIDKYINLFLLISVMYIQLSIGEVLVHKFVMHNKTKNFISSIYGGHHLIHHLDVEDDMKLKPDFNPNGLFFNANHVLILAFVAFITWYPTILLFGYKINYLHMMFICLATGILYRYTWDFLHYSFHQRKELKKYKKNPIFKWLFYNHSMHHLVKGENKGNFNIIFPGGDHLLGTYNSCINNKEYCKNPNVRHIDFCNKEKNKVKLKHHLKWCN